MKKVYFRTLSLEVTRRCQLKCAHCMRGNAQNVDMPFEIIDAVLDQTAGISTLFFTGGEPTLAVAQMDYSLEAIKKRGIPLGGISYITNGVELSESVKQFLLKAYRYIAECREKYEVFQHETMMPSIPRIRIAISHDNFHVGYDLEKTRKEYHELLPFEACSVGFMRNGIPFRSGRANSIKYAISYPFQYAGRKQIGIESEGYHLICDVSAATGEMLKFCDAFIPCTLVITAKGKMMGADAHNAEYGTMDCSTCNWIWQFDAGNTSSILESIIQYNKGKLPCFIASNIPEKITEDNLLAYMNFKQDHEETDEQFNPYDPVFSDKYSKLDAILTDQEKQFQKFYTEYLLRRVHLYSDFSEFSKDFPNSNKTFYNEIIERLNSVGRTQTVGWICANKDKPHYCVNDNLIQLTKHIFRKRAIEETSKKMDRLDILNGTYNRMIKHLL